MFLKKILIINPFGIGDVLFTTPFITQLKEGLPGISIGFVANERTAPLLQANPRIDKVFIYNRDELEACAKKSRIQHLRRIRDFLFQIKRERYDTAIDLSLNGSLNFMLWLTGIPQRIGFDYRKRSRFLTAKIPLTGYEGRHVVDFYNSLLFHLGLTPRSSPLEISILGEDRQWAVDWLEKKGLVGRRNVGLIPGGGASWGKDAVLKRWPAEKFAKLADKLIEKASAAIILMGDEKELELCRKVEALIAGRVYQLCGQTSLGQFAALSQQLSLMIVNDGGPLHVTVAAGGKTVSIFGPVDETVYGPYAPGRRQDHVVAARAVACRPCYRHFRMSHCDHLSCLNGLSVEEVFDKTSKFLSPS